MNDNSLQSYASVVSAVFVVLNKPEQHSCVEFYVKLGKSATYTYKMIKKAFKNLKI